MGKKFKTDINIENICKTANIHETSISHTVYSLLLNLERSPKRKKYVSIKQKFVEIWVRTTKVVTVFETSKMTKSN